MKKSFAILPLLLLAAGCSDKPQESYAQKIERYELEVGKQSVSYFHDQAEIFAEQPITPVLMDTPTNYEIPLIFIESRNGLTQSKPQTKTDNTSTDQN